MRPAARLPCRHQSCPADLTDAAEPQVDRFLLRQLEHVHDPELRPSPVVNTLPRPQAVVENVTEPRSFMSVSRSTNRNTGRAQYANMCSVKPRVPNPRQNVREQLGLGRRVDGRKPRSHATSRHVAARPATPLYSLGELEVPSSNLGAPTEEKTCKSGYPPNVRRLVMLQFSARKVRKRLGRR